ncbi:hypothetical protein OJ998_23850 [Solirubrobacter taibaiensis]|nr:hypothetical protein [Solirubrobacter taibaiensis]
MRRFVPSRGELRLNEPEGREPSADAPPWRLTVRRWPALGRTRVALAGDADSDAVEALTRAIEQARERGDAVSLDLGELTSCPPGLAASYRAARLTPPPPQESPRTG